jgi:hypothetical protein
MKDGQRGRLNPHFLSDRTSAPGCLGLVESHKRTHSRRIVKDPSRGHLGLVPLVQVKDGQVNSAFPGHGEITKAMTSGRFRIAMAT